MANNSSGSERTYYLKQQSPMLHFQHGDPYATLRATELKPKLDKFIKEWMRRKQKDIPDEWKLKKESQKSSETSPPDNDSQKGYSQESSALNYRIRIINQTGNSVQDPKSYKGLPYFGNMGNNAQGKMLVTAKGLIELYIRCYIGDLLAVIDECLPTFFLTANFGTRQDKGFGSFVLCLDEEGCLYERKAVEAMLQYWYKAKRKEIYCIRYRSQTPALKMLTDIDVLYKLLKSGVNVNGVYLKSYLREYFAGKNVDWEKKSLKQHGIAPAVYSNPAFAPTPLSGNEKYVRGLFGVGDVQQWFSADSTHRRIVGKNNLKGQPVYKKETISIKSDSNEIKRVPSPLTFKIIGNAIYILIGDIDPRVPGSWFTFSNESGRNHHLQIPYSNEFSIDEIMHGFMNHVNSNTVRSEFTKWVNKKNPQKIDDRRPFFIQQGCKIDVLRGQP